MSLSSSASSPSSPSATKAPSAGCFITVEGTEGVGKSTNLDFIEQLIRAAGHSLLRSREPGGTPLAEEIRDMVLAPREEPVAELAELMLIFAARAQHLKTLIEPTLGRGEWVLCDRFTDATFAYQGGGRGLSQQAIAELEHLVQGRRRPDCTVLLDAPVEIGMARARQRGELDRMESEKMDFYDKVRHAYLQRAEAEPERFLVIDAAQPLDKVQADIAEQLQARLGLGAA